MGSRESETDEGVVRHPRRWLTLGALIIGAYAAGLVVVGARDALDALARADIWPLLGAAGLAACMILIWPLVHRASTRAVGYQLRYRDALNISLTAWTISHTVPGGGAVGGAEAVRRLTKVGVPGPAATASVTLTGGLSLTTVALIGAGGVAVGMVTAGLPTAAAIIASIAVVALLAFVVAFLALLRSPALADRMLDRLGRTSERLRSKVEGWRGPVQEVTDQPPTTLQLARIIVWCALKWGADLAALALIFQALGAPQRPTVLVVGFGVAQLGAAIPITPGGLGFVEGGMVGAFVTFGVPLSLATTVIVLYRLVATWLPTLAGIPALLAPPSADDAHR